MKRILFAASECVPFIKTGGLADVCGALPKEFSKEEWDVRVVIPNYSCIPEKYRSQFQYVTHFYMCAGNYIQNKYVGILKYELDGVTYYFIDNQEYFTCDTPYGDIRYDIEKFVFFDKAVLSMLKQIDFRPDLIHCHDWQTGLIPVYLKNEFQADSFYWGMKSIITIHNLKFQGVWDVKTMKGLTGFSADLFAPDKLEFHKDANMLKGGIAYCNKITTVSNTYAGEIQTEEYGEGLAEHLRYHNNKIRGIVNGIDTDNWNPATDKLLTANYDAESAVENKKINKKALQESLGLEVDDHKMVIGLISRLTNQKGLDLVNAVIPGIMDGNTQVVVLGTGDAWYENTFRYYEYKYKGSFCAYIDYNENVAHNIYAGCDALLVPSRFEPCGLTQLISMRYGSIPIVRETGGLKDTVQPYNLFDNTGNGFTFDRYESGLLYDAINRAKTLYFENRKYWDEMVVRDMNKDVSWQQSAKQYKDMYVELTPKY